MKDVFRGLLPVAWLKPRSESGCDWLIGRTRSPVPFCVWRVSSPGLSTCPENCQKWLTHIFPPLNGLTAVEREESGKIAPQPGGSVHLCRGTSLIKNCFLLVPYSRPMPRALGCLKFHDFDGQAWRSCGRLPSRLALSTHCTLHSTPFKLPPSRSLASSLSFDSLSPSLYIYIDR